MTALLALAMLPSAETTIGEVTPDSCEPFPGSVSFRSVSFELSVDAVSKPVRPGASRMETAETSVFPAGSPLGGADVVQIVVVRPTRGIRLAWEPDPPWPSNVPPPRINSKPTSTTPSAAARRRVRDSPRIRRSGIRQVRECRGAAGRLSWIPHLGSSDGWSGEDSRHHED